MEYYYKYQKYKNKYIEFKRQIQLGGDKPPDDTILKKINLFKDNNLLLGY